MTPDLTPIGINQARAYERKARVEMWALSATALALSLVCMGAIVFGSYVFGALAGYTASMTVSAALGARRTLRHWAAIVKKQDNLDWETT